MSISVGGTWLVVRPHLGRWRRRARRMAEPLRLSGRSVGSATSRFATWRARGLFWLALLLRTLRCRSKSVPVLTRAIRLDPRFPARVERLGDLYRQAGSYAIAAEWYQRALALDPSSLHAHFWLAVSATQPDGIADPWRHDRSDDAAIRRSFEQARRASIDDPRFVYWLGAAEQVVSGVAPAERLVSQAVAQDPHHPERLEHLGALRAELGDWKGSTAAFGCADAQRDRSAEFDTVAAVKRARERSESYAAVLGSSVGDRGDTNVSPNCGRTGRWETVVARYCDLPVLDAQHEYWLGIALEESGDLAAAIETYQRAIGREPTHPAWFDRLALSYAAHDRWGDAASALQRAIDLEPTSARLRQRADALRHCHRFTESTADCGRAFDVADRPRAWWQKVAQGDVARENWVAVATLYRASLEVVDSAERWYLLGYAFERIGDSGGAVDAYRAAIARDPTQARWHFRLGIVHERAAAPTPSVDARLGLRATGVGVGDFDSAAACHRRATELDPTMVSYWSHLANALEHIGNLEGALDAFQRAAELDPKRSQSWYRIGRCMVAIANHRGAYLIAEHDDLERVFGRVIDLNPGHSGARQQLARASVKAARWELASRTSWYPPPSRGPTATFHALREFLESTTTDRTLDGVSEALSQPPDVLRRVPLEWWFTLHWRLLTENRFTLAYVAKGAMADRLVHTRINPRRNVSGFLEQGRALNFLGRVDDAIEHLHLPADAAVPASTRLACAKMSADIDLVRGHIDPYEAMLALNSAVNGADADQRFREMVTGRRIAVVGPAATELQHGEEIDGFDVVIRTKFVRHSVAGHETSAGSRTDLSYYALGSARFLQADILDALSTGDLGQAVFRTATFDARTLYLRAPGDLRYVPSEYTGGFRAGQFAIPRILYDVLRYRPAAVKVFNINFFLAPDAYRPGYLASYTAEYPALGLTQVLGAFGHDFCADFEFMKRLHEAGLVEVDHDVATMLAMSPQEYLAAMDAR